MVSDYLSEFARLFIVCVFGLSFIGKVRKVEGFELAISSFKILPSKLIKLAARSVLMVESTIIVLLISGGFWKLLGFVISICVLTLFTASLVIVLLRKEQATCSCFGDKAQPVSFYDVARNIGLLAVCIVGLVVSSTNYPTSTLVEAVLLFLISFTLALLVANFRDVVRTLIYPFDIGVTQ